ncbi:C4-type zinc ribbon domain-containing protein [Candidatus Acetothermia bacterium]|nr:C4-type zinc ribbon domain-containing protein [Candidatus Acetothermia bacterium]
MRTEIDLLLEIQAIDDQRRDLAVAINRKCTEKERLQQYLSDEERRLEEWHTELTELTRRSRQKNLEVDTLADQITKMQQRLNHSIISFKETEALQIKLAGERKRVDQMEDEALNLMERIDAMRKETPTKEADFVQLTERIAAQIRAIDTEITGWRDKITAQEREREKLCDRVQKQLLAHYNRLRNEFDDPVVEIRDGTSCQGCNLTIHANIVEKARTETEIVFCENCSRLLYYRR